MIKQRNGRQDAIREVVRSTPIRTQRALVHELHARGFDCTQATVSRDIADMGLCKPPDGRYALPEDLHLQRMASQFVTQATQAVNLTVISTQPGAASGVAAALDNARLPTVLGTIAGDDTVLAISATEVDAAAVATLVGRLSEVPSP